MEEENSAQYNKLLQKAFKRPVRNAQVLAQLASKPYLQKGMLLAARKLSPKVKCVRFSTFYKKGCT